MAATDEMVRIAQRKMPDLVTLVPEKRQELTTEGGLNVKAARNGLKKTIRALKAKGMSISLFINPAIDDVDISKELGADMVEIHTGTYANAAKGSREGEMVKVVKSVHHAVAMGLKVNAGHGLNYQNVVPIAEIEDIRGLYIGHSIIARAVLVGMERAVREMKELIARNSARN
jgi:pyridoxine 5-phosphate synthase